MGQEVAGQQVHDSIPSYGVLSQIHKRYSIYSALLAAENEECTFLDAFCASNNAQQIQVPIKVQIATEGAAAATLLLVSIDIVLLRP